MRYDPASGAFAHKSVRFAHAGVHRRGAPSRRTVHPRRSLDPRFLEPRARWKALHRYLYQLCLARQLGGSERSSASRSQLPLMAAAS
jgi:hypothetical protein